MDRREFLRRGGVAVGAVAALAGCTAQTLEEAERESPLFDDGRWEDLDLPVTQRLEVAEAGIEAAAGATVRTEAEFETYLAAEGLLVDRVAPEERGDDPILSLSYVVETDERGLMDHLGTVAGAYAALVAGGHESELLDASILDADNEPFGSYEIRRTWAEAYDAGELSAREYAHEIGVTVESV